MSPLTSPRHRSWDGLNPRLAHLQAYPFERLRGLFAGAPPPSNQYTPISLGIGEPKHPTPAIITQALTAKLATLSAYPATAGDGALREAFVRWLQIRYGLLLDKERQVLPVNGSREALFSLTQTVIDGSKADARVVCPNPFYQIYEGAALLAGAQPYFAPCDPERNFAVDWSTVPESIWKNTQLVFVCSPGNPTGAVMPLGEWQKLFTLSDRYGFTICSDECYSEIYFGDHPPLGALQAAHQLGRKDYRRLIMITSLSKRSNVPGLRSGFAAGDARIMEAFLRYRTYHGCAMGGPVQAASIAAWGDEVHVEENRQLYRQKFQAVTPILQDVLQVKLPDASFYLWAMIPTHICAGSDTAFAAQLYSQYHVTVLPGSFLAREQDGFNPGEGFIRMALVADNAECMEAAQRIVEFCKQFPR